MTTNDPTEPTVWIPEGESYTYDTTMTYCVTGDLIFTLSPGESIETTHTVTGPGASPEGKCLS
ncbi:hypothetical protein [Streptomyces beijiangensis]|uniref:hypothetical protein n=1 Tax=Streptomyces beijiangensis TaxID=163361 RepID=UPI001F5C4267|nr:hypothetical protein [Streptomyces beijiangensis]